MSDLSESDISSDSDPESVFSQVADRDVERTRREDLRRRLDESLLAPIRILLDDWRGVLGSAIIIFYLLVATIGVRLIPAPATDTANRLLVPFTTWQYPLGTDVAGKGIMAQTVHATPPMLKMIFAGGVFAVMVGAVVGMVAGYKGGYVDQVLLLLTDSLMTLPGLPLVIIITFLFQPRSPYLVGIVLAINNWSGLARSVRSQVLVIRQENYVEATKAMGIGTPHIVWNELLPNLMPYVAVNFAGATRRIIFESVALYFLGVLPTNKPNWGVMMNIAYTSGGALYSLKSAHWLVVPGLAIVLLSLGMILLAQSADKLFNPRLRTKYQKQGDDTAPPNIEQ